MDDRRKRAYRLLLYHCMLDLRAGGPSFEPDDLAAVDQGTVREIGEDLRHSKLVAYWLHNLAKYSADDFVGFNESAFWGQHEFFKAKSPIPERFGSYRSAFDRSLLQEQ
ncbi:MAG TPA: hypothetical protein VM008_19555 [Phycisphaerae bacterium]|nr:hypothetical protein [Phycisphaerae bacterium]